MPFSSDYDYLIAGAGAAGLNLAYQLHQATNLPKDFKVLIVDKDAKETNDRTWCFWSDQSSPFDSIVEKQWEKLEFIHPHLDHIFDLKPFSYRKIKGQDFYRFVKEALQRDERFEWKQQEITQLTEVKGGVQATFKEAPTVKALYAFDSTFSAEELQKQVAGYNLLLQHFKGWDIVTPTPAFDPEVARLFDFSIPQNGEVRFMYVLPITTHRALVEFTVFSDNLLDDKTYDQVLKDYIEGLLQIPEYQIEEVEKGIIPMTHFPFPLDNGSKIHYLGTKGGQVKASTGYGFLRMQEDAAHIVNAIAQQKDIRGFRQRPSRYLYYDAIMLDIMRRKGDVIGDLFAILYRKNGVQQMFRFLSEQTTFAEDIKIMQSVPPLPFLRSIPNLLPQLP